MSTLKTDYILDSAGGNTAQINGMIPVGTTATQTLTNKTITSPALSNVTLTGTLTANSSVGTSGQILKSSGTGIYWESPSAATATYNITVGDGATTSFTVIHNLAKTNIFVSIRDISTGYFVYPDIKYTSANAIVLEFVDPPTSSQYYVAVIGA
jgi:hypothetical protein